MAQSSGSSSTGDPPHGERREVPRYMFIAAADIVEPASGVHMSSRTSEISRKGCFLDILNALPVGTTIQVRISRDNGSFSSPARIIYTQEAMGMGVLFVNTPADQLKILDSWLDELAAL